MLFNATLFALLAAFIKVKFDGIHQRFDAIDRRVDNMHSER